MNQMTEPAPLTSLPQPLTESQKQFWIGQQLHLESPLYNMALSFDIQGEIDENRFRAVFQELISRSDVMRTYFQEVDHKPEQRIRGSLDFFLRVYDWSNSNQTEKDINPWLEKQAQKKFNLSERLFDSALIKLSPKRFIWQLNLHHLITDAWSVSLLYKAMGTLYSNQNSLSSKQDDLYPSFTTYIQHEKNFRTGEYGKKLIKFWKNKSQNCPVPPKLYGTEVKTPTTRAVRISIPLNQGRTDKLRALAQQKDIRCWTEDLSLFNLLLTVLNVFLYRISGQRNLAIGAPVHNRPTADFKKTPGVFIEVLPLLIEIEDRDTFSSLYNKVRGESTEFLKNAGPGITSSEMNGKFNVVFNYIHARFPAFNDFPTSTEWNHSGHCDPHHHLRLQVQDFSDSGEIQLHFDLNCDVFDEKSRKNVPQHFLNLLDEMISDRTQQIETIPITTDHEVQEITKLLSPKSKVIDGESLVLPDLFEKQVLESPDVPAIRFGHEHLNYQALNEKSNQLANYLRKQGVGKGTRVAIYLKRCPEFIISVLGTLKTGATYVPIAADNPPTRVMDLLHDLDSKILITQASLSGRLPLLNIPVLEIERSLELLGEETTENLNVTKAFNDVAYIIFTSGTTGQPKGVSVHHKALVNYLDHAKNGYVQDITPSMPFFTSIGVDLTITSLFLPLLCGGSVVVYTEEYNGPDLSVLKVFEENLVNTIKLTPSHLKLLAIEDLKRSQISTMILGGENLESILVKDIYDSFEGKLKIHNEYGPTEATVGCVVHTFDPSDAIGDYVPIGRAIQGSQLFILNQHGLVVPKGVSGELYIAGVCLANGYWKRPDISVEKFITHPFEKIRMYRTGDIVRLNHHDQLEFLGRLDEQIKIKGMRVEPGEIEIQLGNHPDINASAVVLHTSKELSSNAPVANCMKCGLPSNYPNIEFDETGICALCRSFDGYEKKVQKYFKTPDELEDIFDITKKTDTPTYDCIMLFSGGKDSSYALARLVEMGIKVLAYTLDNGYISEQAKDNIRRITKELNVDHLFDTTPSMNAIFVDSLKTHCNVCNGCFKTIYTLSTKLALQKGIPYIVTGLSRGQFFETRLTEELFWKDDINVGGIDDIILNARKAYHRTDDEVNRLLDASVFKDDDVFEKVQFIDFYRYSDVTLEEMYNYLDARIPWIRPTDTGRSTNCLINEAGIYVHKKKRKYHNYAFPYSWDVRIGHKTLEETLDEINEHIDEEKVHQMLEEIGYHELDKPEETSSKLVAYYTSSKTLSDSQLRRYLSQNLPDYMIPGQFIHMEHLPLTPSGKIDRKSLETIHNKSKSDGHEYVAPNGEIEEIVHKIWLDVLQMERISAHDDFISIGGQSLSAIRINARMNEEFSLELPVNLIFEKLTIVSLAKHVEDTILKLMGEN